MLASSSTMSSFLLSKNTLKYKTSAMISWLLRNGLLQDGINLSKLLNISKAGLSTNLELKMSIVSNLFPTNKRVWLLCSSLILQELLKMQIPSFSMVTMTNNHLLLDGVKDLDLTNQFWFLKKTQKNFMEEVELMMDTRLMDRSLQLRLYKLKDFLILVIFYLFRLCLHNWRRWVIR